MKKENNREGITLVSLAITIIVMIIITGITIKTGMDSIQNSNKMAKITELEMIQEKVNTIYERRKLSEDSMTYYNSLGQDISVVDSSKLELILNGISEEGYRYFSKEDLTQLELSDMSQDVIINFGTRDVVSVTGIIDEGIIYYRLSDIPDYLGHKIEYIDKNTGAPIFDVEVTKLSNSWQVAIKNIIYNSNVAKGTISYKLHDKESWIVVGENPYFEVTTPRII